MNEGYRFPSEGIIECTRGVETAVREKEAEILERLEFRMHQFGIATITVMELLALTDASNHDIVRTALDQLQANGDIVPAAYSLNDGTDRGRYILPSYTLTNS